MEVIKGRGKDYVIVTLPPRFRDTWYRRTVHVLSHESQSTAIPWTPRFPQRPVPIFVVPKEERADVYRNSVSS